MENDYIKLPSGTVTVPQIRKLREVAQTMDMALNQQEYIALITIYNSAIERILSLDKS